MSLDKMLDPDQRKWISPLIHFETKAAELRQDANEFSHRISDATNYIQDHAKLQAAKKDNVLELAKVQGDKIKKLLFQPKKKQRRRKKKNGKRPNETDTESDGEDEGEFENGYEIANDIDELLDEDDDEADWSTEEGSDVTSTTDTDDSEDDRPRHLRKYNKALDEIFIFYSDEEEEKEAEAEANEPNEDSAPNADADAEDSEADEGQKMDVQELNPEEGQEEKDTREFELFHKYSMELSAAAAQGTADDLSPLKYILMGEKAASGRLGNCKIKMLAKETRLVLVFYFILYLIAAEIPETFAG